jgi:hypothetical protein
MCIWSEAICVLPEHKNPWLPIDLDKIYGAEPRGGKIAPALHGTRKIYYRDGHSNEEATEKNIDLDHNHWKV